MLGPAVYYQFFHNFVDGSSPTSPFRGLPPSETQILSMYYEYYYQPLFGRHLRKWKLQADLTQLRENLGSERGSTITHGIDDGAVVSLAERSDPFIWFMAGVVSTLHCLLVPEEIVNDILSTTFTVLHEDGVSLEEAQNPQVKPLDDKMRDVLIELYSGSNQRRCLLNRFGPSTSSGKRLLEDIKSWRHIGFLSGLVAIIHSRLESEPTVEVKIVDTYCRTSPEVVKVELTQFLLGLIRPGGDVLLVETECSDIAISHPQVRSFELGYKRTIEVDIRLKIVWTVARVLHAIGVPFSIGESQFSTARPHRWPLSDPYTMSWQMFRVPGH